jgi:hypothetical protein
VTTGYEVQMYNDIRQIAQNTNRIANCLEAQETRARERPQIDPNSLGAMALWREEVASHNCTIGFSDWLAWHESDRAEVEAAKSDG